MAVINSKQLEKISLENLIKEVRKLSEDNWLKLRQAINKGQ